ncbi:hypothetical protein [Pararhodobacter aggregans]|uniref:Uncharacterized protein n=1 Tax=Pararhodobacter aggregans TaxID=404875 RepID=A0A2T7UT78_9RHOB|nr:hypothetical protein [Pararhodobacter aggregans]PTX03537.1 hypothetical protein C8N33_103339 [Pararhodobacter aggregans]PVE47819.1 hypothetical protein DDE23_10330 [Pararhodobacter aggregans]
MTKPIFPSFAMALALLPLPTLAQDLPRQGNGVQRTDAGGLIIATCRQGEGCHCYQSSHSLATLETQTDLSPPEGLDAPILVSLDGALFWSEDSGHAVDLTYGGDGLCDPQVFPEADTGLPRNGDWAMTITGHSLSGCPDQVAAAIGGDIGIGRTERRAITWPRPFSMAPLTADNPAAGPWVNQGGGVWSTEVLNSSGAMGANARVTMTARILSPVEIAVTSVFSTDALAIITGQTCRSTTEARLRRHG